jgi:methylamine---glutamate N-methyltransferase subunit A
MCAEVTWSAWTTVVTLDDVCGIAGLFAKSAAAEAALGAGLAGMLTELADRGPDSAGVALYADPVPSGRLKVSLLGAAPWPGELLHDRGDQAVVEVEEGTPLPRGVMSTGRAIETAKRAGRPEALIALTGLRERAGTHGLGHTRMATESRVTTEHSHPFSTGEDLCLVHNGSLSNHNALRRALRTRGIGFATDNDSEVAAGFLTWRLREGDGLDAGLERALRELDGFFTLAVGTRDGFAVLRDPVACKPAVLAETDDWVAMASEYRAIATLPGAEDAEVWEPEPARVYAWAHAAVPA